MTTATEGKKVTEATTAVKPLALGTRVCVMQYGVYRGKLGYVRGCRNVEASGGDPATYTYLVTDIMPAGPGVGDWWAQVMHVDLAVIATP